MSPFVPRIAGRTAMVGIFGDSRDKGDGVRGDACATRVIRRRWWRRATMSGTIERLFVCRIPGLHIQHMHNPPVAEILQPFSPKEVG